MALMLEYWYFKVAIKNMFKELKIKIIINDRWVISAEKQELQKKDHRNSRHENYNI